MAASLRVVMFLVMIGSIIPFKISDHQGLKKPHQKTAPLHRHEKAKTSAHHLREASNTNHDKNSDISVADPSIQKPVSKKLPDHRNDTKYIFSAQLSFYREVSDGLAIPFDDVLVNEGGLYFGTSGQFGCPDDSVFMFVWSLKSNIKSSAFLSMGGAQIKEGPQTKYLSAGDSNGNSEMCALVQCRNQALTAYTVVSSSTATPTFYTNYSSFSGYRLASNESAVGFTVELNKNTYLSDGARVFFDNVISNYGGHFDSQHSFFRCPDSLIYAFSFSTLVPASQTLWSVSRLLINRQMIIQGPLTYWRRHL